MTSKLHQFKEVWLIDFEFFQPDGERPYPHCVVGREFHSGRMVREWLGGRKIACPFPTDSESLTVAYFASAELECYMALGWPIPERILDAYVEFRNLTNGKRLPAGRGLLGALTYCGIAGIGAIEKEEMRTLCMAGPDIPAHHRRAIVEYCQSDVDATHQLLVEMAEHIDWPRALLRGRYMASVAAMQSTGIPIDMELLELLRANWAAIQHELVVDINRAYGVYLPNPSGGWSFSAAEFERYLVGQDIPWPRLATGALDLDKRAFEDAVDAYPQLSNLKELRHILSSLRLEDLAVGRDGRNRYMLSPFGASSGRNAASTTKSIYGPSCWMRGLIRPAPDRGLAYVDWSQQEFAIGAALSGDKTMQAAYSSEDKDTYLAFAKQAGAIPPEGTKDTHSEIRDLYKTCVLGIGYGMESKSLALRIKRPECEAEHLLRTHRTLYADYWKWNGRAIDHAMMHNFLQTLFGWNVLVESHLNSEPISADWRKKSGPNPRSLGNFVVQANAAEMMRIASILLWERGINVCCPVHDAFLVEAAADELDDVVAVTQAAMAKASRIVLAGFEVRSDVKRVRYPDRYMDKRGVQMWDLIWSVVRRIRG